MIKVDRTSVDKPGILDEAGQRETEKAIAHYSDPNYDGKSFKFNVYSDKKVKDALIQLFNDKCAYCESVVSHTYIGDVEHFRPKGAITEAAPDTTPGYYWLAADWDNLLFSCRNCNQAATHSVFAVTDPQTAGKWNQFPLSDPARYVRTHDHNTGIIAEEPYRLLLHPCWDDPEDHLEYGIEGIIMSKKDPMGVSSAKGETSIRVYVLQRVPLVQQREMVMIAIKAQCERLQEAFENYNDFLGSPRQQRFETILERELAGLRAFLEPKRPYLGMARQLIAPFLRDKFNIHI